MPLQEKFPDLFSHSKEQQATVAQTIQAEVPNTLFVPCVGDSMSQESICSDGPGVGLGIRRRPWWSKIMRILRLELMHVVDGDSIWHTMEELCAYGMRSRI